MFLSTQWIDRPHDVAPPGYDKLDNHVVLMVLDHLDGRPGFKHALELNGYRVIVSDTGQDAARRARQTRTDLLIVDLDVPLLYGLVAARLILKQAQLAPIPVVIVMHEEVFDLAPLAELGASRNEYVTRVSDYGELPRLVNYLLPELPSGSPSGGDADELPAPTETIHSPLLPASAPGPHLHPNAARAERGLNPVEWIHPMALGKSL
jgi:CheY-like chemotaxis protein